MALALAVLCACGACGRNVMLQNSLSIEGAAPEDVCDDWYGPLQTLP